LPLAIGFLLESWNHSLFLPEQFCCYSLVERIFQKLIYLQFEELIFIFFKQLFGVSIDRGFDLEAAGSAEFDVFSIAEYKTPASGMLTDCIIQQAGKLIHRQILRNKAGTANIVYVPGKDFLAALCELDYLNE
jgi:hypothetical protein